LIGCAAAVGSLLLWCVAFCLWRFFAGLWLVLLNVDHVKSWSFDFACVATALLAVEGFRYHRRVFDLIAYHESAYYRGALLETDTGHALNAYYGNPAGMAYLVSQTLFSAPRSTVLAIKSFRALERVSPALAEDAAVIYNALYAQRGWMPASELPHRGRPLALLDKLKLIWTEIDANGCRVRIPQVPA
jgi:hypothetical protein